MNHAFPSLLLKIKSLSTFTYSLKQTMNSTYQTHTHHKSEEDREFSFWGSPNTISSEKNDHDQLVESNETRLNSEAKFEHDCSRSKAIAEGRKELMEMIQDIPESSYELSFQDMVLQQQHVPQTSSNETLMQSNSSSEPQQQPQNKKLKNKNKKKNKSNRHGQILRVESMDSETFLLKMFFPTSFDWMKRGKVQHDSKVSSKSSFQESTKQVDKEWRIKRFFSDDRARQNSGSSSSSSNDKSRYILSFIHKTCIT